MNFQVMPPWIAQGYRTVMAGNPAAAAEIFSGQAWDDSARVWLAPLADAYREAGIPALVTTREDYLALLRSSSPNGALLAADMILRNVSRFSSSDQVLDALRKHLRSALSQRPRVLPDGDEWKNIRHRGLRKAFRVWLKAAHEASLRNDPDMLRAHNSLLDTIEKPKTGLLTSGEISPEDLETITEAFYRSLSDPLVGGIVADRFADWLEELREKGSVEGTFLSNLLERARKDISDPASVDHKIRLAELLKKKGTKPVSVSRPQVFAPLPAKVLEDAEALSGYDSLKRARAVESLKEAIPDLTIPQVWELVLKIGEKFFFPPGDKATRRTYEILRACLPHLQRCPELPDILERAEAGISASDSDTRLAAGRLLECIAPHIPPQDKAAAVEILNDMNTPPREMQKYVGRLAYAYGDTLSYGAIRALILAGRRMIAGGERDRMGDRLKELGDRWQKEEKRYRGHPTLGGKIRKKGGHEKFLGYPVGRNPLLRGETRPVLLHPVGSPAILARTIWDLAWSDPERGPLHLRFSLSLSGQVGDDLREAVFGVHSLLRSPPAFPANVAGEAGIEWYAPVVEGGGAFSDIHQLRGVEDGRDLRYDYLFLGFSRPPKDTRYFDTPRAEEEWTAALETLIAEMRPRLTVLSPSVQTLQATFDFGGESQTLEWRPSQSDWETLTASENNEKTFQRLFFLEWAREAFWNEISEVIESAWVLGMLREIEKEGEDCIPFSAGFTGDRRRRLKELAGLYRTEIRRLFREAEIADVLETPWVGNRDWQAIRADRSRFQEALKDASFRVALQNRVRETVQSAHAILFP